jgi:hypothetical protein
MIDETRYFLGTLCKRGHSHEGSARSLRYQKTPVCVQCAIDHRRAVDAEKRVAREAAAPPPLPDGQRRCAACKNVFAISEFKSNGIRKCRCRDCARQYAREYLIRNPDKAAAMTERNRARHLRNWQDSLIRGSQSSARVRGLDHKFDVAMVQELWERQGGLCYWFKTPLEPGAPSRHPMKPSLDRLDGRLGYVPGNVVLASYVANMGRGPASVEVFAEVVRKIQHAAYDTKLAKAFERFSA